MSNPHADFLQRRRSTAPADLAPPAPDEARLHAILTLAARTPDHGRLVPYRFIVMDQDACRRLAAVVRDAFAAEHPEADAEADAEAVARAGQRFEHAPMIVAVVSRARPEHPANPKIPEWEQVLTAGAVCMNLLHAAHALGYGAVWLTGWTAYHAGVLGHAGLEPGERLAGWVHLGTAELGREDRERPGLDRIVTHL